MGSSNSNLRETTNYSQEEVDNFLHTVLFKPQHGGQDPDIDTVNDDDFEFDELVVGGGHRKRYLDYNPDHLLSELRMDIKNFNQTAGYIDKDDYVKLPSDVMNLLISDNKNNFFTEGMPDKLSTDIYQQGHGCGCGCGDGKNKPITQEGQGCGCGDDKSKPVSQQGQGCGDDKPKPILNNGNMKCEGDKKPKLVEDRNSATSSIGVPPNFIASATSAQPIDYSVLKGGHKDEDDDDDLDDDEDKIDDDDEDNDDDEDDEDKKKDKKKKKMKEESGISNKKPNSLKINSGIELSPQIDTAPRRFYSSDSDYYTIKKVH